MNKLDSTTILYSLPKDVVLDIFTRVATKSVGILACVSKFFNSLVTDASYAALHYTRWSAANVSGENIGPTVLLSVSAALYVLDITDIRQPDVGAKHVRFMDKERFRCHRPHSFAHGTICLCSPEGDVALCHLSTGQHVSLPPPQVFPDHKSVSCVLLGFDSVSRRYKVVKSVMYENNYNKMVTLKHWVFTVGVDDSWREILLVNSPTWFYPTTTSQGDGYNTSVHIAGVIYSLSWHNKAWALFDIMAFDVALESFEVISCPYGFEDDNQLPTRNLSLVELEGELAIIRVQHYDVVVVWVLEKCCRHHQWKKHVIHIPLRRKHLRILEREALRVTTTPRGEIVFLLPFNMEIWVLFDIFEKRLWNLHKISGVPYCYATSSSAPLVIVPHHHNIALQTIVGKI